MLLLDRWPLPGGTRLRDRLLMAYGDPTRHYHDSRHLTEVFARLDELSAHGVRFDAYPVTLAAWFHDAVYDRTGEDEDRSARLAGAELPTVGVPDHVVAEVVRLVRLTESHHPDPGDHNGAALVDADLGILAAPPERYASYAAGVRREYIHLGDGPFAVGRAAILRELLAKTSLFHTGYARSTWEDTARHNIAAELRTLQ